LTPHCRMVKGREKVQLEKTSDWQGDYEFDHPTDNAPWSFLHGFSKMPRVGNRIKLPWGRKRI